VTAKELNISFLKEKELSMKQSVDEMRETIKRNWRGTREELLNELDLLKNGAKHTLRVWDERSTDFVRGFIRKFDADGVVQRIFRLGLTPSHSPDDTEDSDSDHASTKQQDGRNSRKRSASTAQLSPESERLVKGMNGHAVKSSEQATPTA
jgi:choline-phosphate cytidylyltransferase